MQSNSHPIAFWFFIWGEFAERCSYYGMRAILLLYMIDRLGVDKKDAPSYMSVFIAACYFFPLIGGWIADKFLGKYWTIVLFSVPYVIAQFLVGIENKYVAFGALTLLAMGSGVIKPNISTLLGITYDQQRPGQDQLRTSAFSYFYMSINVGAWLSQLIMPYLRVNYSFQVAFLFPAGLMIFALIIFALGKRFYGKEVIVRKFLSDDPTAGSESKTITGIPVKYVPQTQEQLDQEKALRYKTVLSIGALFLTTMVFWAIFDQSASTWIQFADTYMTEDFFGVPLTADQVQSFNALFIILMVPVSVQLFKLLDRMGYRIKATTKILVGFGLTAVAMFIIAYSATLAGPKTEQMKIETPEGVLIVPLDGVELEKIAPSTDSTAVSIGGAVKVSSTAFGYNTDKNRLEFKNGTITLSDGSRIAVVDGHLQATIAEDAVLEEGGILEPRLKKIEARAKIAEKLSKEPTPVEKIEPVYITKVEWTQPSSRVPVAWQVFAYFIITIAEILISITGLELAFVAAPKSMKGFVTALWLASVGCANLFINAPVTQLYSLASPAVYFAGLGVAMMAVMVIFLPIAAKFNKNQAEVQPE